MVWDVFILVGRLFRVIYVLDIVFNFQAEQIYFIWQPNIMRGVYPKQEVGPT